MRRLLCTFALLFCGTALAQEPAPKTKPLTAVEVQQYIELLGSRDYRERERASKALAAEGERILPQLKAALEKIESPEVQRRLEVMVAKLNAERVFRPSFVSVDCKNKSVKSVLADICKQAGYKFQDSGGADRKITLKLDSVPFWEAMGAVSEMAGLTITPQDDVQKVIYAYANDTFCPHVCVSGPFKFTPSSISSSRTIQLSNIPRRGQLTNPEYIGMGVQIFAEPKMPLVGIGEVTVVKATDDKGMSLIPPNADENRRVARLYVANNYRSLNQSCSLNLVRGHRDAMVIRELEAKVAVSILVEERPEITVENLLDAKKKKFAGSTFDIEFEDVSEAMGTVSLKIAFRPRDASPDDYNWANTAIQRLAVYDDKGLKMTSNGLLEQNIGPGVATMLVSFSAPPGKKGGKPSKLILNEWITESREVTFKFKNVPLP